MKKSIWNRRIGRIYGDVYERFMAENSDKSDEEFDKILVANAQKVIGELMDEFGISVEEYKEM